MSTTATEVAGANGAETNGEAVPVPLTAPQKMAVARAARAFSNYGEAKKAMARIAKAIVNLRLTFEKDGRPDFRGETPQYRGAIATLYEAAIHDPQERETFKVAVRYWIAKEFAARVESGDIKKRHLQDAGLMLAPEPASTPEPRRAKNGHPPTGVVVDGVELSPSEVLVEAERIVAEHAATNDLGPVIALQSISRELGPVVAVLRDEKKRDKLPGRSLRASTEAVLNLALDAAEMSGIDVTEYVAARHAATAKEPVAA